MSVSAMVRHRNFVTCCFFPAPSKKLSTSSNSVLGWLLWPAQQVQALMQFMGTVLHQLGGMKLHPNCIHLIKITIFPSENPWKLALWGVPNISMTHHFYSSEVSWWLVDVNGNDGPILNFYHSWNLKMYFSGCHRVPSTGVTIATPSTSWTPTFPLRSTETYAAVAATKRRSEMARSFSLVDPSLSQTSLRHTWELRHYQIIHHLNGTVKVNPHPLLGYVLSK